MASHARAIWRWAAGVDRRLTVRSFVRERGGLTVGHLVRLAEGCMACGLLSARMELPLVQFKVLLSSHIVLC